MPTIKTFIMKQWAPLCLALVLVVNLFVYHALYGFHPNNDTDSFLLTIEYFRGKDVALHPNRFLNPLYPLLGATVFRPLTPEHSIILTNIIFYVVMLFATYGLIRRVFKNELVGLFSALLLVTNYAMLRYGLTQVQDMGGYAWFVVTLYYAWRWFETNDKRWLLPSGLAVGLGMLTKESGAMGALFAAVLFVAAPLSVKERLKSFAVFTVLPLIILIINQIRGRAVGVSSLDWYLYNWQAFGGDYRLFKWIGVNGATFNLVWIAACIGALLLIKRRHTIDRNIKIYFLAVVIPSLSYLAWPSFIARTVVIAAWLLVPLVAYALFNLYIRSKIAAVLCLVVMMITPYVLQSTLKYAHVFQIYETCNRRISCSWKYFWNERKTFSATM